MRYLNPLPRFDRPAGMMAVDHETVFVRHGRMVVTMTVLSATVLVNMLGVIMGMGMMRVLMVMRMVMPESRMAVPDFERIRPRLEPKRQ